MTFSLLGSEHPFHGVNNFREGHPEQKSAKPNPGQAWRIPATVSDLYLVQAALSDGINSNQPINEIISAVALIEQLLDLLPLPE